MVLICGFFIGKFYNKSYHGGLTNTETGLYVVSSIACGFFGLWLFIQGMIWLITETNI
jgi:hypothetical protein